jgi:putative tryptophan/tyrosine transport system substrate-binding protein
MIRRRRIGMAGGALALLPQWLAAQQAKPARREYSVGVLGPDTSDGEGLVWDAFVVELAQRGYVRGRNLVLEMRLGQGDRPEQLDKLAAELVALKPDVIYAARGTVSALAAKRATATIPIVFYSSGDPVAMGLVASLARPGGNLTGNSVQGFDLVGKAIELLTETLPKVQRIAYLQPGSSRDMPWYPQLVRSMEATARARGVTVEFIDVAAIEHIEALVAGLARQRFDAAIVVDFPLFRPHLERIAQLCIRYRLPAYGNANDGFLMHYGEQRLKLARMAAAYVDRILQGARPAELPVEQIATFEMVINLKTARALGLSVPAAVMVRASRVIE